ncbi:MAG: cupin domain-containing protein [Armatimonadetes bacterium]|nr:cupin domain-containing protein [Armatimonadota bacterium]
MIGQKTYEVLSSKDMETLVSEWVTSQWFPAEHFTVGVAVHAPGGGHFRHSHPDSEEILYVLYGDAVIRFFHEGETKEYPAPIGTMIYIPPGVEHEAEVTGWEPWKVICVYAPPGPERRLRERPGELILPPGKTPTYRFKEGDRT